MNTSGESSFSGGGHARKLHEEHILPREVYYSDGYFERPQLISLCEQIALVHELKPRTLLEVGLGNGFVSEFLRRAGVEVTTVDVNPNLEPDIIASVADLEQIFSPNEFDSLLCCEVLEHLPFEVFPRAINAIASITNKSAVISLPTAKKEILKLGLAFRLHRFDEKFFGLRMKRRKKNIYAGHHWEIDYKDEHSINNVIAVLEEHYNSVSLRIIEANPYHCFFVCKH